MNRVTLLSLMAALLMSAACSALAQSEWPDRANRTPEQMLEDLIRHQQTKAVRQSFGELAHECFTDEDFAAFKRSNVPEAIVTRLKRDADFRVIADALRALPQERLDEVFRSARRIARPTWRVMGFIDPQGRYQTEAGHNAEILIAEGIVAAFADELRARKPAAIRGA